MSGSERSIVAVIIDTSSFIKEDCDFLGVNTRILLRIKSALRERGITLLTHPILLSEIRAHLSSSRLLLSYDKFMQSLERNKKFLPYYGIHIDEEDSKRKYEESRELIYEAFKDFFDGARYLTYPDPEQVFEDYFRMAPPFSQDKNKKYEFPDAFVIKSIKQYLGKIQGKQILVISNDLDWKTALTDVAGVIFSEQLTDIFDLTQKINNEDDKILEYIREELVDNVIDVVPIEIREVLEKNYPGFEVIISSVDGYKMDNKVLTIERTNTSIEFRVATSFNITGTIKQATETIYTNFTANIETVIEAGVDFLIDNDQKHYKINGFSIIVDTKSKINE